MPSDNAQTPPPFSVLIVETEAELKQYLQAVQFVASTDKLVLDSGVENHIKKLVQTLKILRRLQRDGWETISKPECTSYFNVRTDKGKQIITKRAITLGVVGDIAELCPWVRRVFTGDCEDHPDVKGVLYLDLPRYDIWVKAKYLPSPQSTQKLTKVTLADGNTTWLTPQTLKQIRRLLINR